MNPISKSRTGESPIVIKVTTGSIYQENKHFTVADKIEGTHATSLLSAANSSLGSGTEVLRTCESPIVIRVTTGSIYQENKCYTVADKIEDTQGTSFLSAANSSLWNCDEVSKSFVDANSFTLCNNAKLPKFENADDGLSDVGDTTTESQDCILDTSELYVDENILLNSLQADDYKFWSKNEIEDSRAESVGSYQKFEELNAGDIPVIDLDNSQVYRICNKNHVGVGQKTLVENSVFTGSYSEEKTCDQNVSDSHKNSTEVNKRDQTNEDILLGWKCMDQGLHKLNKIKHSEIDSQGNVQSVSATDLYLNNESSGTRMEDFPCTAIKRSPGSGDTSFGSQKPQSVALTDVYWNNVSSVSSMENLSYKAINRSSGSVDNAVGSHIIDLSEYDFYDNSRAISLRGNRRKGTTKGHFQYSESLTENSKHDLRNNGDDHSKLQCTTCKKLFSTQKRILEHLALGCSKVYKKSVIVQRGVSCIVCNKLFHSHHDLEQHEKNSSCKTISPKGGIRCRTCNKGFSTKSNLGKHEKLQRCRSRLPSLHQSRGFQCLLCEQYYKQLTDLKKHLFNAHKLKYFECRLCNRFFKSLNCMMKHEQICKVAQGESSMNVSTSKQLPKFGKPFIERAHWLMHIEHNDWKAVQEQRDTDDSVSEERSSSCIYCNTIVQTSGDLAKHLMLCPCKKSKLKKGKICQLCNSVYSSESNWTRHIIVGRCKGLQASLELHGRVNCFKCDQPFSQLLNLQRHFSLAHGLKPFLCSACGKLFKMQMSLSEHYSTCKKLCNTAPKREYVPLKLSAVSTQVLCHDCKTPFKKKKYLKQHIDLQRCKAMKKRPWFQPLEI